MTFFLLELKLKIEIKADTYVKDLLSTHLNPVIDFGDVADVSKLVKKLKLIFKRKNNDWALFMLGLRLNTKYS